MNSVFTPVFTPGFLPGPLWGVFALGVWPGVFLLSAVSDAGVSVIEALSLGAEDLGLPGSGDLEAASVFASASLFADGAAVFDLPRSFFFMAFLNVNEISDTLS